LLDVLPDIGVILIGGDARGGIFLELIQIRLHQVELVVFHARDDVPRERIFQRGFADLG